ncbi:ParB/RepB/Spo0J family partition protein [Candidatus Vallotia tarda]|uniref:Chromosome partitioning protein parB n=1 Tax=Candidatus Vallotiella hemipterorum TaxID=1177213 RepID=A0A8D9CI44_9BURK|nr:ParB/RepB/Spo0J family partition protein [Candidatus Vallotia tarda]CAD6506741.1 Chromosome partitioning protein parB [Candidatus Vallotia tarda]CAG7605405.1 Chromosome partitioning protein parB [Candidatus Vallotia tarda]
MKSTRLARGFRTQLDITTSEKKTSLERFNTIDILVKQQNSLDISKLIEIDNSQSKTITTHSSESVAYSMWCTKAKYTPGQIIQLPLQVIKLSSFNPRYFYLKSSIQELAINIAKQGQQQAIHVIPDHENPGTFFLSDGGRRIRALKESNHKSVKAIVVDLPIGIESYKLGYDLNVQRDSQTVFDNAIVWQGFLDKQYFKSQRELAEMLGIDESTVAVALGIAKLPEIIMREMLTRPDRFGSNMAYQIARFNSEKGINASLKLINKIIANDLSTRQVADIIKNKKLLNNELQPSRRQRYKQRLEIKINGTILGDLKSYGNDRLELKLKGLIPKKREELLKKIEKLLMPEMSNSNNYESNITEI